MAKKEERFEVTFRDGSQLKDEITLMEQLQPP